MKIIPLSGGAVNAHQQITVQLGVNLVELKLDYQQSGQWSLDLYQEDLPVCLGAMLEPNADAIESWRIEGDMGRLVFMGKAATLDNLGIENQLIWVAPDEL